MKSQLVFKRGVRLAVIGLLCSAAFSMGMVASPAKASDESAIMPASFVETAINVYDHCRDYYTSTRFNPSYRTITYLHDFYETGTTFLYSKGYGLYYLYTPGGTYLGNYMTTMDHYQVNYYIS